MQRGGGVLGGNGKNGPVTAKAIVWTKEMEWTTSWTTSNDSKEWRK